MFELAMQHYHRQMNVFTIFQTLWSMCASARLVYMLRCQAYYVALSMHALMILVGMHYSIDSIFYSFSLCCVLVSGGKSLARWDIIIEQH